LGKACSIFVRCEIVEDMEVAVAYVIVAILILVFVQMDEGKL
jgi:hypothetical protein